MCLKERLCEYVLQGREGIKGEERKAGTKKKGRGKKMSQEKIHGNIQTSAAVRDPAAVSKKSAATGAPFTGAPSEHSGAGLQHRKQENPCFPQSSCTCKSSCAFCEPAQQEQMNPKPHRTPLQADCCLCDCTGKMWQNWNTAIHKVQHHIHGAHSLCMASLGKGAACTGKEHEVCTVSKTLPNHKKLPYLTAFM